MLKNSTAHKPLPVENKPKGAIEDRLVKQWGNRPEIIKNGWVALPFALVRNTGRLGITPAEFLFIATVFSHKWTEDAPYPSFKTIAEYMGVHHSVPRRLAASLERKGLLVRETRGNNTSRFHFDGLFEALAKSVKEVEPNGQTTATAAEAKNQAPPPASEDASELVATSGAD